MKRWWLRLVRFALPYWPGLCAIALFMLATAAFHALKPWPLKILVDYVLPGQTLPDDLSWLTSLPGGSSGPALTAWLAAGTSFIFAIAWLTSTVHAYLQSGVALRITYAVASRVFEQLQRLSLRFHSRQPTGDLVRRVTRDSRCARDLMVDVLLPAQSALISLVTLFVVMVQLDLLLTLVALLVLPAIAVANRMFYGTMQERSLDQHQWEGALLSQAEQALTAIPMIQAFRRENAERNQFRAATDQTLTAYFRGLAAQLKFRVCTNAATTVGRSAVMIVGGYQVLAGDLTVGSLLVFLTYVGMIYDPMSTLANMSGTVAEAEASAQRVFEVIDAFDVVPDSKGSRHEGASAGVCGEIAFDGVSFSYDDPIPVLSNIDLHIRPGETLALVGPTGAGKSTLVSLLMRFFDPSAGRILFDGTDIRAIPLDALRLRISILLQDAFLLPVTVAENIAYGRPDASMEEIRQAAITANADHFISRLPYGYETVLGEQGVTLSGGEKQRLGIARALLKNAPVLILDEPTSALDAETEASFVTALQRLTENRTTLIIAHRLSTLRNADQIVVLDQGRIVEQGSHQQLKNAGGAYAQLLKLQIGSQTAREKLPPSASSPASR